MRSDITVLCDAALDGRLSSCDRRLGPARGRRRRAGRAAAIRTTVRKGDVIHGLDEAAKLPGKVFHAGTALDGDAVVTSGGRVLCAVGLGRYRARGAASRPTTS